MDSNSDQFLWCAGIAAAVARGVRFCDSDAKSQCISDATLHLYSQLKKFDATRGVPLPAYAGFIVRRRLIRLAQIELRARLHCRVRPERPYRATAQSESLPPVCCKKCRTAVSDILSQQIEACKRSDAEPAAWTRDVLIGQRRLLTGK